MLLVEQIIVQEIMLIVGVVVLLHLQHLIMYLMELIKYSLLDEVVSLVQKQDLVVMVVDILEYFWVLKLTVIL